jgi:hypothetical protein
MKTNIRRVKVFAMFIKGVLGVGLIYLLSAFADVFWDVQLWFQQRQFWQLRGRSQGRQLDRFWECRQHDSTLGLHCLLGGLFYTQCSVLTVWHHSFKQVVVKVYGFEEIALTYVDDWPDVLEMSFLDWLDFKDGTGCRTHLGVDLKHAVN